MEECKLCDADEEGFNMCANKDCPERASTCNSDLLCCAANHELEMLAQSVVEMPPLKTDDKSVREWAKRLAADISKGND